MSKTLLQIATVPLGIGAVVFLGWFLHFAWPVSMPVKTSQAQPSQPQELHATPQFVADYKAWELSLAKANEDQAKLQDLPDVKAWQAEADQVAGERERLLSMIPAGYMYDEKSGKFIAIPGPPVKK